MFRDEVCVVTDFQHVNPGKGAAFVRAKLKNVQSGKTVENTFKVGENVDTVDLDRGTMQYLYKDAENYFFMDNTSYEQVGIPVEVEFSYRNTSKAEDGFAPKQEVLQVSIRLYRLLLGRKKS